MPKSFIKIKPVTSHSEAHNNRERKPKYLIAGSNENIHIADENIQERRKKIEHIYKKCFNQKMQQKSTPIKEAVVLLPDDNNKINLQLLFALSDELEKRYGIRTFQWHIHNDEGFVDTDGKAKYNYHAHLIFDWTEPKTGKSLRLSKDDMSDIQTLTAEILGMERGIKGSKNLSLTHQEYRGFMSIRDSLAQELKRELSQKEEYKIRETIKQQRDDDQRRSRKGIKR